MEVRYLESVAGEHVSRATRFNGPGWYVLDDQGDLVSGPYPSREKAEKVVVEQFTAPRP
ncbi:hypothetical protein MVG78_17240 [Roseomonas gilardii subsp. gilardii]|uniref:hypothetical protein n=1 Tax=Roseomonas gilardii TaxID=257708 RepID=UPI001FFA7F55|nr:hypothetical protein [Roseomonas gilardii]UPG72236.1 hypothetical protein MVG78_17240 [Roseomonas gilardii subsp. gilardii]